MDHYGSLPEHSTGDFTGAVLGSGPETAPSLSVYAAEPGSGPKPEPEAAQAGVSAGGHRDGFTGSVALQGTEALTQAEAGVVLARLDHLMRWAQAQQARVLNRLEHLFREDLLADTGRVDPGLTFTLAAEEAAAILNLPTGTAKMLMSEAGNLCSTHVATLQSLEAGFIGYGQVQTVLDQSQNVPAPELAGFEAELLTAAVEQTQAQFRVRARRLRENRYPETVVVRHRTAFESRRVYVQPDVDGMSWLSALLPAPKAQAIFTQLSTAARGEQAAGDPRLVDQLRADILADLLGGPAAEGDGACVPKDGAGTGTGTEGGTGTGTGTEGGTGTGTGTEGGTGTGTGTEGGKDTDTGTESGSRRTGRGDAGSRAGTGGLARGTKRVSGPRTEILVLISAETLCGADDLPAELHGYGPISPESARKLVREAARWTPVERDPHTEEILRIGRRRKIPPGLQRWLRARDGTCRFPGCRTNALLSEIDHTKPWVQGGVTDHDNLEHLCRRHHMFKTRGFWKARQCSPGIIEWTSPGGRTYRTEPHLSLAPGEVQRSQAPGRLFVQETDPNDYGHNPPPF